MNSLKNIAISASAGSGKTYQLTNRFIRLLHLTEQPERIIALTFTRAAAGEFFLRIINKLADAANDTDKARDLSDELSISADRARYHHLLELMISRMHKLNLQTLDSFFFRIVSSFALELGLSGTLNLLDESEEQSLRNEVRNRIVHRPGELTTELKEFWHAFKQATYGKEERSVGRIVSEYTESLYTLYLEAPRSAIWGKARGIWPYGCPWKLENTTDWDQLANAVEELSDEALQKERAFATLLADIRNYPRNEKMNTMLARTLGQADEIFSGTSILKVGRKEFTLDGKLCTALGNCLRAVIWHHLERALENTQGVFRILQAYHDNYDRIVRRPGRLAFADLAHLLAPESTGSPMGAGDAFTKQLIDFRLDGQYDHWLFDEFQDTSRPQWDVVSNLVDEIVQDTSGQRSLFYVGDTKQCLYLWRNSDDRLFHEIQGQYPSIEPTQLATSWRSAPAILEAVNTVFSDHTLIAECFSDDAAARWDRAWQRHEASKATKELSGYACWREARKEPGPTRNERILETLEKLKPIERGMSVGILVRKNEDATNVADYIRENSNYPVHTGSALRPAIDNAAGVALLAMIRLAAHPGDLHAQGFLSLIDHSNNGASLINTAKALRKRLYLDSYATAVAWAAEQIAGHLPTDDIRHRERLDLLVEKAHAFDNEGRRDLDALYHYLETSSSGECETEGAIIVETIHKSKGLEYDVVILVCEDKTVQSERRISPLLDKRGKAEWVMEPIKKELMQADPELGRLYHQNRSQQGFGNLCILYVGMTRAKRALYMISDLERVSKGSTVHFLRERFGKEADENGTLWETGNPDWSESFETALDRSDQTLRLNEETIASFRPAHPRLQLARPSQNKMNEDGIARLFNLEDHASEFGTSVHAVFEKIEWLEDDNLSSLLSNLDQDSVAATIQKSFENKDIRRVFTKPPGPAIVWRERSFSYIDGNQLINGVFDRVNLYQDETGKIISAEIIDFKTDRIEYPNTIDKAIEYHRSQLETYRKVLSRILGLSETLIQPLIIFTSVPARCEI